MRPDIAYKAWEISLSIKDATINDLTQANKYIRKAESESALTIIVDLENLEQCSIIRFCHASFTNLKRNSFQGGFMFLHRNKNYSLQLHGNCLKQNEL